MDGEQAAPQRESDAEHGKSLDVQVVERVENVQPSAEEQPKGGEETAHVEPEEELPKDVKRLRERLAKVNEAAKQSAREAKQMRAQLDVNTTELDRLAEQNTALSLDLAAANAQAKTVSQRNQEARKVATEKQAELQRLIDEERKSKQELTEQLEREVRTRVPLVKELDKLRELLAREQDTHFALRKAAAERLKEVSEKAEQDVAIALARADASDEQFKAAAKDMRAQCQKECDQKYAQLIENLNYELSSALSKSESNEGLLSAQAAALKLCRETIAQLRAPACSTVEMRARRGLFVFNAEPEEVECIEHVERPWNAKRIGERAYYLEQRSTPISLATNKECTLQQCFEETHPRFKSK